MRYWGGRDGSDCQLMTDGWLRNAGRRAARGDGLLDDILLLCSLPALGDAAQIGPPGRPQAAAGPQPSGPRLGTALKIAAGLQHRDTGLPHRGSQRRSAGPPEKRFRIDPGWMLRVTRLAHGGGSLQETLVSLPRRSLLALLASAAYLEPLKETGFLSELGWASL